MQWSPQQDAALIAFRRWFNGSFCASDPVFLLFGYAGTGKSTLAKFLAQEVGGHVCFAAYTGKASCVMRKMGCRGATTVHGLIYISQEKPDERVTELARRLSELDADSMEAEELRYELEQEKKRCYAPSYRLREEDDVFSIRVGDEGEEEEYSYEKRGADIFNASLIIVDEVSMVNEKMGRDLLSFGKPILVLGDPMQLPPIEGGGFFTKRTPHVELTEIHRQARDNPIIDLATRVRLGETLSLGTYGKSRVVTLRDIESSALVNYDQVLVWTNRKRSEENKRMRLLLGHERPYPEHGEKLVCLRNNHRLGLLNGALWMTKGNARENDKDSVLVTVVPTDEGFYERQTAAWKLPFEGHGKQMMLMPYQQRVRFNEFDYGYALTVHKAQGSQFESVLLFDEYPDDGDCRANWLYTGITRAVDRIDIVKMG